MQASHEEEYVMVQENIQLLGVFENALLEVTVVNCGKCINLIY